MACLVAVAKSASKTWYSATNDFGFSVTSPPVAVSPLPHVQREFALSLPLLGLALCCTGTRTFVPITLDSKGYRVSTAPGAADMVSWR